MIFKKSDLDDGCLQDHLSVSSSHVATSAAGAALSLPRPQRVSRFARWVGVPLAEEIERTSPRRAAGTPMEQERCVTGRARISPGQEASTTCARRVPEAHGRVIQVALFSSIGAPRLSMVVDNPIVGAVTCGEQLPRSRRSSISGCQCSVLLQD